MENIQKKLTENRPQLSESSIKTYISIISNLYKKMNGDGDPYDFFRNNTDKVLEYLKDDLPNLRKTKLAVLISLLSNDIDIEPLRTLMLADANQYNAMLRDQQRNSKQEENWVSMKEIERLHKDMGRKVSGLMKKNKLDKTEYQQVLHYVLLSLFVLIPPRRSQDYSEMKIRNYDTEKDNYYDGTEMVFSKYKTAKTYGRQEIKPPLKLKKILNKWKEINKSDWLLASYKGTKISVSKITLIFNKIFGGKNVSTSLLRHIYITERVLHNAPTIKQMEAVATQMGHDIKTQANYRVME